MRKSASFKIVHPGWTILRALVSVLNIALIFLAVQEIPLIDSTLLLNAAPFFVPFLVWIFLKEPINHKLWLPILTGFIGIIFILKPNREIFNWGAIYALLSGVCTALSLIIVRYLTGREKLVTVLFYLFLISTLFSLPTAIYFWETPSYSLFGMLLLLGVFTFLGQWTLFKALEYGDASHIAPFGYAAVVYTGIFDWLFFNQLPDLFTLLGVVFIVLGGMWILHLRKKTD